MRFTSVDGTNTMKGETPLVQSKFTDALPYSKYMNCRNHKLAIAFIQILLKNKELKLLADADALLFSLWKMMKYFSVKAAAFNEVQNVENQRNMKILKTAPARCLSRGEASKHVIARFGPLVNDRIDDTGIKSFRDTF